METSTSETVIRFSFADAKASLVNRKAIKAVIASIFKDNDQPLLSLQYVFCSDEYLLDLNKRFLNHDTYTDIITFTLSGPGQPVEGEIYISVDRVRENAQQLGVAPGMELHRVIFHGALHLCGFKDKTLAQKQTMRNQEDRYINKLK